MEVVVGYYQQLTDVLAAGGWYERGLFFVFAFGLVALFGFWRPGQYGRHAENDKPLLAMPTRFAWFFMEAPASLVFAWFFFTGSNDLNAVCWVLFVLWQVHYVHRAFIFPFQIRVAKGHKTSIEAPFVGGAYCALNGGLNGYFIGTLSQYDNSWLTSWQFVLGIALFIFGYFINKQSDRILKKLRKPGESGYKVPYGGAYRFVSSPNYMGEIMTWTGFALAAWSMPALSFAYFTAANLIPRAVLNHRWYKESFEAYPKKRKAIIPFLL